MNAFRFFFTAEVSSGSIIHGMVDVEKNVLDNVPSPTADQLEAIEMMTELHFNRDHFRRLECSKVLIHEFKEVRAAKGTAFYLSPDFTRA